jgi:hypothetical protein
MKYVLLISILAANATLAQTASSGILKDWEVQKLMQKI